MIRFVSSIPGVPLPDPLWYELVEELAPQLPDLTVDIAQWTAEAEHFGETLLDKLLRHYGVSLGVQYPEVRQGTHHGMVLLLSARDCERVRVDCPVVCYESGHPREWVEAYPHRLWVTRFWFGGPVWLTKLGVEHVVFDAYFLTNRAWMGALTRFVPCYVQAPTIQEAYDSVLDLLVSRLHQFESMIGGVA